MFVAFLYLMNFTVHIDLVLAQRPNYISAVPVLEKGLTQPFIILIYKEKKSHLFVFL